MGMYDIIGSTEIIGNDMRALMSGDAGMIASNFTGRVPEMRQAMERLASMARNPLGVFGLPAPPMSYNPVCRPVSPYAPGQLAEALAANTPIAVKDREITEAYEVPFGFQSLAVPAGAIVAVQLQPAATFKPNRMSIPQAVAPSFQLTGFLIGQTSLILNGNAVPAEAFSDVAFNPRGWKLPTIQVGQPATMQWQNISGAAADLRGNFWGVFVA